MLGVLALFLFSGRTNHSIYSESDFGIENVVFQKQRVANRSITFKQATKVLFAAFAKYGNTTYSAQEAIYSSKSRVALRTTLQNNNLLENRGFLIHQSLHKKESPSLHTIS